MLTTLKFKEWIKGLGCVVCGSYGVDPHHVNMGDNKSRRIEDESRIVPLCRRCHDSIHKFPFFESKYKLKEKATWLYDVWLSIKI